MTRRKTNLSRNTRKAKSVRRVIAHQTEEELTSVNERSRQRMTQIRANETAEECATRLEDARLRVRQSRSLTSDELRSLQENTIGYKWLKDVNKEQHISLSIALHSGTTQLRIIV
ncbi:hypothetical protein TNCV_1514791 [Trichonephila clavipes]|nr:hypothetical protein TNCV_1514791 [Trichonephila clavipes]